MKVGSKTFVKPLENSERIWQEQLVGRVKEMGKVSYQWDKVKKQCIHGVRAGKHRMKRRGEVGIVGNKCGDNRKMVRKHSRTAWGRRSGK